MTSPDHRDLARQILAQQIPCKEHPMPFPKPSCWTCGRNGAFHRAALIALGEFPGPVTRGPEIIPVRTRGGW